MVVFTLSRCGYSSVGDLEVVSGGMGIFKGCLKVKEVWMWLGLIWRCLEMVWLW